MPGSFMRTKYKKPVHVFVVSDATGMTAERVTRAALVQFSDIDPKFKKFTFVRERERIRDILDRAERLQAIVIYSLASLETRKWLRAERRARDVYTIDLLGPPLRLMEKLWNTVPDFRPGILTDPNGETMRLAESIDFTLKHDDGQNIDSIDQAELIILGISRTSKTPTSLYLSCNFNLKVANYPIILGEEIPETIFDASARMIGFTITAKRAAYIRRRRLRYVGDVDYTDIEYIKNELRYSHKSFSRLSGLHVVDVTDLSIEEIANDIMESVSYT
ncbi:Phosphoenolpyruvate synthase regulatory protein [Olavius algarvensis associated proteobacterium Delta 3]|nr:Phosphoenolpyruvate synthase regulatory protein [Olavius algarvensis associated proteobacterium Delta 3]